MVTNPFKQRNKNQSFQTNEPGTQANICTHICLHSHSFALTFICAHIHLRSHPFTLTFICTHIHLLSHFLSHTFALTRRLEFKVPRVCNECAERGLDAGGSWGFLPFAMALLGVASAERAALSPTRCESKAEETKTSAVSMSPWIFGDKDDVNTRSWSAVLRVTRSAIYKEQAAGLQSANTAPIFWLFRVLNCLGWIFRVCD